MAEVGPSVELVGKCRGMVGPFGGRLAVWREIPEHEQTSGVSEEVVGDSSTILISD